LKSARKEIYMPLGIGSTENNSVHRIRVNEKDEEGRKKEKVVVALTLSRQT